MFTKIRFINLCVTTKKINIGFQTCIKSQKPFSKSIRLGFKALETRVQIDYLIV